MKELTPAFLLANPELVAPAAPWCVRMDNLELGLLLVAHPWVAEGGIRRADAERQLRRLEPDLPVGAVYFQRVNRAAAALESRGALSGSGEGRQRRFATTAAGFAALILNMRVLHADPTLDGREFELKRGLVALWNVLLEQALRLPGGLSLSPGAGRLLDEVERVSVWGQPVITEPVLREAFDILGLIALQRDRVHRLREAQARLLEEAPARAEILGNAVLGRLRSGDGAAPDILEQNPEMVELIRSFVSGTLPGIRARAKMIRYDAYLGYLDRLEKMYTATLTVVDIGRLRRTAGSG